MKNKQWYIVIVIGLIVAGIYIKKRGNRSFAETIKTVSPVYGNIRTVIATTGDVEPQNRLEIKPPIGGRVESILVVEGQRVKVGQVLALLSSTERAALLDAARSQGEEAFKYWQEAYKPVPLLSPINGEVIVRAIEPGQTVSSNEPVVVISDRLIIKAQVDETDIGKVKLGQNALVSLDAFPQVEVKGRVDHISYESKVVNNVTMYQVDILPDKVPAFFRSGMSTDVEIIEQYKENVLTIPLEAVNRNHKEEAFVLLSQGKEKPHRQRVELGLADDKNVEIVSGLEPDSKIIIKVVKYNPTKQNNQGSPFMPARRGR